MREAQQATLSLNLEPISAIEPGFNLADSAIRNDLLPFCQKEEIATITFSPLAAGFLTGKYTPGGAIPKGTRFDVAPAHGNIYFTDRNFKIVENLKTLSEETGEPMTRLAMAWVFQHSGVSSILIGARKYSHIDNALEAMEHPIDQDIIARMNSWLDRA